MIADANVEILFEGEPHASPLDPKLKYSVSVIPIGVCAMVHIRTCDDGRPREIRKCAKIMESDTGIEPGW
jgi:hypothetical protein